MKSKLALIFAGTILAVTSANLPAKSEELSRHFIEIQGQTSPEGYHLVSYNQAHKHEKELCSILHKWDIARLANNASMDGPGYGCKIRLDDNRHLRNALVVRN